MLQKSIFILLLSFTLNASETVICIHGFHGAPWNMYLLEKNFNRRGFDVTNWGYPSSDKTIESHGQDLVSTLQKIALNKPGAPMFFVTHSMGGLVLRSALNHPHALKIETKVNGELRQSATTEQLIFDIPELISVLSQGMTLEPGDIIATGTPAGVGMGFTPPKLLKAGDTIEITIEGIGTLINSVNS